MLQSLNPFAFKTNILATYMHVPHATRIARNYNNNSLHHRCNYLPCSLLSLLLLLLHSVCIALILYYTRCTFVPPTVEQLHITVHSFGYLSLSALACFGGNTGGGGRLYAAKWLVSWLVGHLVLCFVCCIQIVLI